MPTPVNRYVKVKIGNGERTKGEKSDGGHARVALESREICEMKNSFPFCALFYHIF